MGFRLWGLGEVQPGSTKKGPWFCGSLRFGFLVNPKRDLHPEAIVEFVWTNIANGSARDGRHRTSEEPAAETALESS